MTEKQIDRLFEIAHKFPADKLDWKPDDNTRSALDQLQEVATALPKFLPGIKARKIEFDPAEFAKWVEERSKITSLDELERLTRESTKELLDYIRTVPESDLDTKVDMPFPGEFKVADLLSYTLWNASYHEGQINYISFMLEGQLAPA
jgi:uncharacterized damage-inducible protein DinB